jgi:hypothetical protein
MLHCFGIGKSYPVKPAAEEDVFESAIIKHLRAESARKDAAMVRLQNQVTFEKFEYANLLRTTQVQINQTTEREKELIAKHEKQVEELIAKHEKQVKELTAEELIAKQKQVKELIAYEKQVQELIAKHEKQQATLNKFTDSSWIMGPIESLTEATHHHRLEKAVQKAVTEKFNAIRDLCKLEQATNKMFEEQIKTNQGDIENLQSTLEMSTACLETSKSEISLLNITVADMVKKIESNRTECSICLQGHIQGRPEVVFDPCGHVYHESCARMLPQCNRLNPFQIQCPMCRCVGYIGQRVIGGLHV